MAKCDLGLTFRSPACDGCGGGQCGATEAEAVLLRLRLTTEAVLMAEDPTNPLVAERPLW